MSDTPYGESLFIMRRCQGRDRVEYGPRGLVLRGRRLEGDYIAFRVT